MPVENEEVQTALPRSGRDMTMTEAVELMDALAEIGMETEALETLFGTYDVRVIGLVDD